MRQAGQLTLTVSYYAGKQMWETFQCKQSSRFCRPRRREHQLMPSCEILLAAGGEAKLLSSRTGVTFGQLTMGTVPRLKC